MRKATEKNSACELDAKWRKTNPAGTGTVRDGPRRTLQKTTFNYKCKMGNAYPMRARRVSV